LRRKEIFLAFSPRISLEEEQNLSMKDEQEKYSWFKFNPWKRKKG